MFELTYFPSKTEKEKLNSKFRFWHVESLLNQAATLMDFCLKDLREIKQLDVALFLTKQEIDKLSNEIALEESSLEQFDRDIKLLNLNYEGLIGRYPKDSNATQSMKNAKAEIDALSADGVNFNNLRINNASKNHETVSVLDREIIDILQTQERKTIEAKTEWAEDDKRKNINLFNFRKQQLEEKKDQLNAQKSLDFKYQMELYFKRVERNYADALSRSLIAEQGLTKIYGYNPQQSLKQIITSADGIQEKTNELSIWLNDSIKAVSAYSQLDQTFTICLSLKSLIGTAAFDDLKLSETQYQSEFIIPESVFPLDSHENIRFRSIGASIIGESGMIPWKIEIKLPDFALYHREDTIFEIDQSDIPKCLLGKVRNAASALETNYCGMISLLNGSPISHNDSPFKILIQKPNNEVSFSGVSDFIIEFNLSGKLK